MEEKEEKQIAGMSRRSFALGAGGGIVMLAMGGLKVLPTQTLLRAPGGQDEARMLSACIRCERCIETCPQRALEPSKIENGILSVRTPTFNFDKGYCSFCEDENDGHPLCVQVCPTQALKLNGNEQPADVIIGYAAIDHELCLAWAKYNGCHFCKDACEEEGYNAIYLDDAARPLVETSKCIGCGHCQNVCVSTKEGSVVSSDHRAIRVYPVE